MVRNIGTFRRVIYNFVREQMLKGRADITVVDWRMKDRTDISRRAMHQKLGFYDGRTYDEDIYKQT